MKKTKKYAFGGNVDGQPMSAFGSQGGLGTQQMPTIQVQNTPAEPQGNPMQPGLLGLRAQGFKKGGKVKKMAVGGSAGNHGQPTRPGRTTGMGQPMKMAKGGVTRADGCAVKGKTKGKMV